MKSILAFLLILITVDIYAQRARVSRYKINDTYSISIDSVAPRYFNLYLTCNAGTSELIGILEYPIDEVLSIYFNESNEYISKREISLLYYNKHNRLIYFSAYQILSIKDPFLVNHNRNLGKWVVTSEESNIFGHERSSGFRIIESIEWINRTAFVINFKRYMQYDNYRLLVIENNGEMVHLENCEPGWLLMNRKENQAK